MGLLDKLVQPVKTLFSRPSEQMSSGYRTFTEYSPAFAAWDGDLYGQLLVRAIVERVSVACSKLKPEFTVPEGSGGSLPRIQRLFRSWPNDMQTWPDFLRVVSTRLFMDNVAYIVPGYDARDRSIVALYSLKPNFAEVVEYEGEPWWRFHLTTGEVQAFPFYDVAVLTRFQYKSDIFGTDNTPLTPTLRLMDAQRQAEEIALRTSADIRFIGKLSGMVHQKDMDKKRQVFSDSNLSPSNQSGLLIYDQTFESVEQLKTSNRFTVDTDEMDRIKNALYAYFGISEEILNNSFNSEQWAAFYEGVIEPFALQLSQRLTQVLLTPTQVRKGNHIMFSSGYLEYATPDAKVKVVGAMLDRGIYTVNESRDVLQLPRIAGGDVRMIRGEYYMIDDDNNIIAESGGRTDHDTTVLAELDTFDDLDEPDDTDDDDEVSRALSRQISRLIERRLAEVNP